jgi:hypothetical protein
MVETCFSFTVMLGFGRPMQIGRRVFPFPCGPCLVLIFFFEKNLPLSISFFSEIIESVRDEGQVAEPAVLSQ